MRVDTREWHYGGYFRAADGTTWVLGDDGISYRPDAIEVDPDTVGLYSGLCDKNGTRIFEGDIVSGVGNKDWEDEAPVLFDEGEFRYHPSAKDNAEDKRVWNCRICNETHRYEVVGNIYE